MILPIYVISLYCNIKHLFETWKYLYKSGSPDNKCIDSHPHNSDVNRLGREIAIFSDSLSVLKLKSYKCR